MLKKSNLIFLMVTSLHLLFINTTFGQDKKIIRKDIPETSGYADYEVLKSSPLIKNGFYKEYFGYNHQIRKTGFYKDNLRDSLWSEFGSDGSLICRGKYREEQKVGEWSYYVAREKLFSRYDFSHVTFTYIERTVADSIREKTTKYKILVGMDTVKTMLDRSLCYLGGDSRITRFLSSVIRVPAEAKMAGIRGRVVISLTIDSNGLPRDYRVKQSLGYGCDEEVLRAIKLLENDWIPAVFKKQKVASIITMPFSFSL